MSILISAPIRTGKTLYAIKLIFEQLNKGRMVYTNIIGIKIDGVISVSSTPNEPFDWRDLPNGCCLVWDEAHEHPAFSEQDLLKQYQLSNKYQFDELAVKTSNDQTLTVTEKKQRLETIEKTYKKALELKKEQIRDIGRALLMHGHYGIEIIFITQRVTKLNTDVLSSVTSHFVLRRKFGSNAAIVWEFGEAMPTWSKTTAQIALNKTYWKYPKHLYKFYTSSEDHKVRRSFPFKYFLFALIPLFLFGYSFIKAKETGFFGLFDKESKHPQQTTTLVTTNKVQEISTTNSKPLVCNYDNIHTPECQEIQKLQQEQLNSEIQKNIVYTTYDPYLTQVPTKIEIDPQNTDFPRLSGCVKYNSKYVGIDQQGNRMPNIREEACRRWIENAERPFNYFADNHQYRSQESETSSSLKIVKNEQNDNLKNIAQQTLTTN